ncbi:PTS transporter subunit EIIC [Lentilactobacillus buchneri]|uniref:PTS EIIC type-1 domain-containing protein n=1 Tax=Lentilactobacillus buchneri DSM 20057 TaxID=1423728 RepID=A0A4R5NSE8_LENBU|nr:PTS transporter subunit EIIC [Lentilactobacillus buchneri]AEB74568.1 Protein-N(pi)-phosphohistidine--sugar phosphotransferase [Lentilactobacillus buchneri NRRL B-30929]MCT2881977.1 PTS sucrose transporter subunit IIABC [Lentilactobacillus buchneri]MCT2898159.1 PTS sucrose transporter subunit IIABC [Lentilactobacillus buchneri]MCT3251894.1 PTS sucrose transporter subunit IIABC [Lentilactobacillus buchneri]MCT3546482.1 PTS sucrose transporter subunit IIABC [Lentilactobacillus buchneri]
MHLFITTIKKTQKGFLGFINLLADIFVPIIPAIVAAGLLMALHNVLVAPHLFMTASLVAAYPQFKGFAAFINVLANAPFAFLPVLIGFSATKRFGGNPYLGAAMGMMMVSPALVSGYDVSNAVANHSLGYWHILGMPVAQAGYQGSVIPMLAVAWLLSVIEKQCHKRLPEALDYTFAPLITILLTGILTFMIVGPVMRDVSDGLTNGLLWLYQTSGAFGTGVLGLFYAPLVITGLHQSFPAIETQLIANVKQTGGSFIFPIASVSNIAQGASALAVFFLTKDKQQRGLASSASMSALLGITEPAMFGINLKLKFPFIASMIGSAVASVYLGLTHVLAVSLGSNSVLGFISIATNAIPAFLISMVIAFVVSFSLTYVYGRRQEVSDLLGKDDKDAGEAIVAD